MATNMDKIEKLEKEIFTLESDNEALTAQVNQYKLAEVDMDKNYRRLERQAEEFQRAEEKAKKDLANAQKTINDKQDQYTKLSQDLEQTIEERDERFVKAEELEKSLESSREDAIKYQKSSKDFEGKYQREVSQAAAQETELQGAVSLRRQAEKDRDDARNYIKTLQEEIKGRTNLNDELERAQTANDALMSQIKKMKDDLQGRRFDLNPGAFQSKEEDENTSTSGESDLSSTLTDEDEKPRTPTRRSEAPPIIIKTRPVRIIRHVAVEGPWRSPGHSLFYCTFTMIVNILVLINLSIRSTYARIAPVVRRLLGLPPGGSPPPPPPPPTGLPGPPWTPPRSQGSQRGSDGGGSGNGGETPKPPKSNQFKTPQPRSKGAKTSEGKDPEKEDSSSSDQNGTSNPKDEFKDKWAYLSSAVGQGSGKGSKSSNTSGDPPKAQSSKEFRVSSFSSTGSFKNKFDRNNSADLDSGDEALLNLAKGGSNSTPRSQSTVDSSSEDENRNTYNTLSLASIQADGNGGGVSGTNNGGESSRSSQSHLNLTEEEMAVIAAAEEEAKRKRDRLQKAFKPLPSPLTGERFESGSGKPRSPIHLAHPGSSLPAEEVMSTIRTLTQEEVEEQYPLGPDDFEGIDNIVYNAANYPVPQTLYERLTNPDPAQRPSVSRTLCDLFWHIAFFYFVYICYVERQMWLQANNVTRAFVDDLFHHRNQYGRGISARILPEDYSVGLDRLWIWIADVFFGTELEAYAMPG